VTETKHTPGPWVVRPAKYPVDGQFDYAVCAKFSGTERCLAESFGRVSVDDAAPAMANAHLIAAAPDLYEACAEALAALEMNAAFDWGTLDRALAKARGET
jgi:hypothetical protein